MDLWSTGVDIYRSDDMSSTSFTFDRIQSVGGSSDADFDQARTGSDSGFNIYTAFASHQQYLDADKIRRLSGYLRWIQPNDRLVPAKMTTFGGLYSVRGYNEDEIVADGGILFSVQYEYDLVKHCEAQEKNESESDEDIEKPWLRKLAPLVFFDLGRAKTKHPVSDENETRELCSAGVGLLATLGDSFDASIYYGYPLRSTDDTDKGDGQWNFNFIMRW